MSTSSLNNQNNDFDLYTNDSNYENINSVEDQDENKRPESSTIETGEEGEFLLLELNER
jgi:hypothetical protein